MTRENKLALIVGFSVILVVGVLVSDHFSKARQDQLREINEQEIGSVGVDRAHAFTPIEPLVSDEATPIATGPDVADRARVTPPWHAPRSGRGGLLGGALDAQGSGSTTSPARQPSPTRDLAPSATDQPAPSESPLHIRQGQPAPSRSAIAARDDAGRGFERMIERGTLIPLTRPATLAPGTTRGVSRPLPPTPEAWEYHVRKNDSLYSIAQELLGSGRRYTEILELNKDRLPDASMLRIGLRLRMPADAKRPDTIEATPRPARAQTRAESASPRSYTVESGDTLGQISQRLLGSVKRMNEIIRLNSDQISDADEIRVGMTLKIPAG